MYSQYDEFLKEETTNNEGKTFLTHERLVRARNSLTSLVRKGTLFTYIDPHLVERIGSLPATNNAVESLNAQLRVVLREHRGLSLERRVKAAYWWCYMEERLGLARHTFCPITRTSSQAPSSAAKPNTVAAHASAPSHARASSPGGTVPSVGPEVEPSRISTMPQSWGSFCGRWVQRSA